MSEWKSSNLARQSWEFMQPRNPPDNPKDLLVIPGAQAPIYGTATVGNVSKKVIGHMPGTTGGKAVLVLKRGHSS